MIMLVGEAWGKEEELVGQPFVGASGKWLRRWLAMVGIRYEDCYVTNVLNLRPRNPVTGGFHNDIKNCCGKKADGIPGYPAVAKGKYMRAEFAPELERLYNEIDRVKPTLIIALGGTASWALLKTSGIKGVRGSPIQSIPIRGNVYKVFPTYHPAAILREWKIRPILLSDLYKCRAESEFPEIRRPSRLIWIEPTLADLARFEREYIIPSRDLSIDIETAGDQITEIGFAPTKDVALVVPFMDDTKPGKHYWPTLEEEIQAWLWVRRMCQLAKRIVGQNFLFDTHRLWRSYGITVLNVQDDTMLLHHALQPEMEKGLEFLGSIYTNESKWKFMRHAKGLKKED